MGYQFRYSVAISEESLTENTPVLFRGDIFKSILTAKTLGYDAVELHLRNASEVDGNGLRKFCDKNGMSISALATGLESSLNRLTMQDKDTEARMKIMQSMKAHIDLANSLNCTVIIGMVRGNIRANEKEAGMNCFKEQLMELLQYAAGKVKIVIEAINFYINNYLNTVVETADFVREFGASSLGLHIDTHHMNIQDYDPIASIHYAGKTINYVHFAEINRMYPGAGRMDFPVIMNALKDVSYQGYISIECIPVPDAYTAAKRSIDYLKSIYRTV
ncbi:sugar phosphate isomerase/epimerase [Treponema sp. TIM-1]|uniref:sugar phosphate isomerase/epimerase family protein n=1 Tax=Treponema sp. TIM-1 TaxID=2898417 RepID=UPI0039801D12